jgi:hypothetical protein
LTHLKFKLGSTHWHARRNIWVSDRCALDEMVQRLMPGAGVHRIDPCRHRLTLLRASGSFKPVHSPAGPHDGRHDPALREGCGSGALRALRLAHAARLRSTLRALHCIPIDILPASLSRVNKP